MAITEHNIEHFLVVNWGLVGASTAGMPGYRSANPWQQLEHYMERQRSNSETFFRTHGAACNRIDRGGSVWRITFQSVPTPSGLSIDEFADLLLHTLVANITPQPGDHIVVTFAGTVGLRQLEWTP